MVEEQWKPVVGYEGLYEVSDQGRVRSLDKVMTLRDRNGNLYSRTAKGRLLRPGPTSRGYLSVALHRDKKQSTKLIHHLVAIAFIGPRPEGMQVCHGPAGKLNNSLANVYYGTVQRNNKEDKERDGTLPVGEANPAAVLTERQVREILTLKGSCPRNMIARLYGVSPRTIGSIFSGKAWSHLHRPGNRNARAA